MADVSPVTNRYEAKVPTHFGWKKILVLVLGALLLFCLLRKLNNTRKCNADDLCSQACHGIGGCTSTCSGKNCIVTMDGRKGKIIIPQDEIGLGAEYVAACLRKEPVTAASQTTGAKFNRQVKKLTKPITDLFSGKSKANRHKKGSTSKAASPRRTHPRSGHKAISAESSTPSCSRRDASPRRTCGASAANLQPMMADGSSVGVDVAM